MEILVDIAIVALVGTAVVAAYSAGFRSMEFSRSKIASVALANEKMEEIRNMPYDDLATEHGLIYPPGEILDDEEISRKGIRFNVHTIITYVDDPFDGDAEGTIPGKPVDLYPYDYKKVEVIVNKIGRTGQLAKLTSNISAKAAETESDSGILKICIIDEEGLPVEGAIITIQNDDVSPPVDMQGITGADGCIMVPNLPPDHQNNYHLTATKDGFTTDMTYPRTPQNPNALQPDVDIIVQQVTRQTLKIDKFSTMIIDVVDTTGAPVPNAALHITGAKEIYFNPSTPKYSADHTTDENGHLVLSNMEFDDYTITTTNGLIVSTSPYQPVGLHAETTLNVRLVVSGSSTYPIVADCSPRSGSVGDTVSLTITGDNFTDPMDIKLTRDGQPDIVGTNFIFIHKNEIEIDLNLAGALTGFWNLIVANAGGETVTQTNGFEIQ